MCLSTSFLRRNTGDEMLTSQCPNASVALIPIICLYAVILASSINTFFQCCNKSGPPSPLVSLLCAFLSRLSLKEATIGSMDNFCNFQNYTGFHSEFVGLAQDRLPPVLWFVAVTFMLHQEILQITL